MDHAAIRNTQSMGNSSCCRIRYNALFATYSIAMWKDPLFLAAILVITVLLFDLVATKGTIATTSKAWIPLFALESIAIVFLRSNSIAIEVLLLASLLAYVVLNKKDRLREACGNIGNSRNSNCRQPSHDRTHIQCTRHLAKRKGGRPWRSLESNGTRRRLRWRHERIRYTVHGVPVAT